MIFSVYSIYLYLLARSHAGRHAPHARYARDAGAIGRRGIEHGARTHCKPYQYSTGGVGKLRGGAPSSLARRSAGLPHKELSVRSSK
eukprot:2924212-Pleurochrysis_carterae.AAC.1